MFLSLIFNRIKGLGPVAVVGTAVLVTVKLLTTHTPEKQEELKVNAEEDISLVNFKDEIIIPPPPEEKVPEQEEKEEKESEPEDSTESDEEEDSAAEEEESSKEQEDSEQKNEEKKDQEKSKPRQFIKGNKLSEMLSKLLSKKKK